VEGLAGYGIRAFVIACNTATSVGASFLRKKYDFPIIGMEPAIKPAVEYLEGRAAAGPAGPGRRALLAATALALKSRRIAGLKARVDPRGLVDAAACPELVEYAERLEFDETVIKDFLKRKLDAYDLADYGCVVLGCTHFSYFRAAFADVFPAGVKIMDGNAGTVKRLVEVLGEAAAAAEAPAGGEILLRLTDSADLRKIEAVKAMLGQASGRLVRLI
jgi:glutamate racemase